MRERRPTPLETGGSNPPPRSTILQAFAVGLQLDAYSVAAGRKDGEEGAPFRPLDFDQFSYACGFNRGRQLSGKRDN
jgi:hypothetical protein